MATTATCKGCGARVRVVDVNGSAQALDLDGMGRPVRPHACGAAPTVGTAPISASAPISAPAPATAAASAPKTTAAPASAPKTASAPAPTGAQEEGIGAYPVADMLAALEEAEAEERAEADRARIAAQFARANRYNATARAAQRTGGIPPIDPHFMIDRARWSIIEDVLLEARETGEPQNIGFWGEPGSGKTSLAVQIGAILRAPTFVIDTGGKETATDFLFETIMETDDHGNRIVRSVPSDFVRGIETPGAVVIVNDVANLQRVDVQNGLNELLDPSTRATYIPALGRPIVVAEGVIIICTWNRDTASSREISEQIVSRIGAGALFEIPFPTNGELTKIIQSYSGCDRETGEQLAAFTDWMRADPKNPIRVDTRRVIAAARRVRRKRITVGEAVAHTVLGYLSTEEQTRAFALITVKVGAMAPDKRALWAAPKTGASTDKLTTVAADFMRDVQSAHAEGDDDA